MTLWILKELPEIPLYSEDAIMLIYADDEKTARKIAQQKDTAMNYGIQWEDVSRVECLAVLPNSTQGIFLDVLELIERASERWDTHSI